MGFEQRKEESRKETKRKERIFEWSRKCMEGRKRVEKTQVLKKGGRKGIKGSKGKQNSLQQRKERHRKRTNEGKERIGLEERVNCSGKRMKWKKERKENEIRTWEGMRKEMKRVKRKGMECE